tara:strand:- start:2546 stop:3709 length:1164 start_codon:yes stop_codon:yes gene_type:complete
MRKILFVSSTPLSKKTFDGKEKRALSILKSLSKKNKVDVICIDQNQSINKKKIHFCNNEIRFQINLFQRFFNTLNSLFHLKPLQNGYFYSKEMFNFIENNKDRYDVIIFHLIRCAQYLPPDFSGMKILEMTDLISIRDQQIIKRLSIINPLKYLYILERFLIKRYEKIVSNKFDKIVFISKKELYEAKKFIDRRKIEVIENIFKVEKNIFKFKSNNNKIIFLGNINYIPNKLACFDFAKNILPIINKKYPDITFNIIGKINFLDKFYFKLQNNTIIHGPVKNLETIFKNSICGICNVNIATGFQNKILNYMSYGLPTITSVESFDKSTFKKNKDILVYSKKNELIKFLLSLKEDKKLSYKLSRNSFNTTKNKFKFSKIFMKYQKILK